jgi:hypothetical protein
MKVEHEYERAGAWAYLAALDVHHARLFGRCEPTTGIDPFDRLVEQVMTVAPYRHAQRVFWIVDNGPSHRGARGGTIAAALCESRARARADPCELAQSSRDLLFHRPTQRPHAERFRIVGRMQNRLLAFQRYHETLARPFEWTFTRRDLARLLAKLTPQIEAA